jgi:PAS domain S-box-containing protein
MKAKTNTASRSRAKRSSKENFSPTERNDQGQAEQSLQESRAILANAEEVAKLGSWKWDLHTKKLTCSDGMFRLFGMDRESVDGDMERILADRIQPDDIAAVNTAYRSMLEGGEPAPLSFRVIVPDGIEQTVWAKGKLLYDENGQPASMTGFVQDITERVPAENKILQLKRLYATLRQVNQVIVRVKKLEDLLQAICDIAVKYGGFSPVWIGLVNEESGEIRPVAANGLDIKQWIHPRIDIKQEPIQNGLITEAVNS